MQRYIKSDFVKVQDIIMNLASYPLVLFLKKSHYGAAGKAVKFAAWLMRVCDLCELGASSNSLFFKNNYMLLPRASAPYTQTTQSVGPLQPQGPRISVRSMHCYRVSERF